MRLVIQQRPDGQTEIVAADQSFLIRKDPPDVAIPNRLLQDLRLSELPDQIGVKPLGMSLVVTGGEQVDCWLYGFHDGYAFARVLVTAKAGPSVELNALQEAVRERQEKQGDVEPTESDPDGDSELCFLLDLLEDVPIPEALDKVEQALTELDNRRMSLLATQPFRKSAAT
ncbi:MAG: hypothetical protein ABSF66_01020 [Terriglobales bacterium]|jgi:hypothetical protein